MKKLPKGFPTHTKTYDNKTICLGDRVGYKEDTSIFTVIFENNAFRKKYDKWDEEDEKPILEYGNHAKIMKLTIIKKAAK